MLQPFSVAFLSAQFSVLCGFCTFHLVSLCSAVFFCRRKKKSKCRVFVTFPCFLQIHLGSLCPYNVQVETPSLQTRPPIARPPSSPHFGFCPLSRTCGGILASATPAISAFGHFCTGGCSCVNPKQPTGAVNKPRGKRSFRSLYLTGRCRSVTTPRLRVAAAPSAAAEAARHQHRRHRPIAAWR